MNFGLEDIINDTTFGVPNKQIKSTNVYDDIRKETRTNCNELFLTLLSGLRKTYCTSEEDKAYNNALADAFDYIIETQSKCLLENTVRQGKWVRD